MSTRSDGRTFSVTTLTTWSPGCGALTPWSSRARRSLYSCDLAPCSRDRRTTWPWFELICWTSFRRCLYSGRRAAGTASRAAFRRAISSHLLRLQRLQLPFELLQVDDLLFDDDFPLERFVHVN